MKKYLPSQCTRISILDATVFQVFRGLEEIEGRPLTRNASYILKDSLRAAIEENLLNKSLDKYKSWGKKLALVLLNALLTLPLVTLPLKRMATGSWFFSLKEVSRGWGKGG